MVRQSDNLLESTATLVRERRMDTPLFRRSVGLALAWWLVGLSIDTSADVPPSGDPVVVRLKARAEVSARVVTVGHVSELLAARRPCGIRSAGWNGSSRTGPV